jgi:hypothetical protein
LAGTRSAAATADISATNKCVRKHATHTGGGSKNTVVSTIEKHIQKHINCMVNIPMFSYGKCMSKHGQHIGTKTWSKNIKTHGQHRQQKHGLKSVKNKVKHRQHTLSTIIKNIIRGY